MELIIGKKIFGEEHANVAASYNNLGIVYGNLGQYSEAKEYHEKALIIKTNISGEENADVARLSNLRSLFQEVAQVSGEELSQVSANHCSLKSDDDNLRRQRNQTRTKLCILF